MSSSMADLCAGPQTEEGFELLDTKTTGYPGRTALMWAAIKVRAQCLKCML